MTALPPVPESLRRPLDGDELRTWTPAGGWRIVRAAAQVNKRWGHAA